MQSKLHCTDLVQLGDRVVLLGTNEELPSLKKNQCATESPSLSIEKMHSGVLGAYGKS